MVTIEHPCQVLVEHDPVTADQLLAEAAHPAAPRVVGPEMSDEAALCGFRGQPRGLSKASPTDQASSKISQ